jgi:hypothetical protein
VVNPPAPFIHEAPSGQTQRSSMVRKQRRPWSIPPGLGMPGEPFEAAAVLEEMPDDAALLLWLLLRDVDVAVAAERTGETGLFAPGAEGELTGWIEASGGLDETLREQMRVLARLLGTAAPGMPEVSAACSSIAEWASNAGFGRTAYVAAIRASAASPQEPSCSYQAGIMARRIADYVRAEAWLKRTVSLARHLGDGRYHALALLGLANLHILRYEFEPAIQRLQQTLGIARRFALWDLRPRVYHDLFCIATTEGTPRQAAAYGLAAARGYGRFHPLGGALAHDVAYFLIRQNRARVALRVLRSLPLTRFRTAEQLLVLGTTAWAAGSAGEVRLFLDVWNEFWKRLDTISEYDRTSGALINLAWGAASLKDATRLEVAAREALRIALPRCEMLEVREAEQMLACLQQGVFPEPMGSATGSPQELRNATTAAERLLRDMLRWPHVRAPDATPGPMQAGGRVHHNAKGGAAIRKLARRLPG